MSVNGAASAVRVRQTQADGQTSRFAASDAKTSILGAVVQFVPTEFVTVWTGVLGVIAPKSNGPVWIIFGVAIVTLVVITVLDIKLKDKAEATKEPNSLPTKTGRIVRVCVILVVAFASWALASAGSPLSDMGTRVSFGVAAVVSLILPKVAQLLDIRPQT